MDIGVKTWDNLKQGDILLLKKEVNLSPSGFFVSQGSSNVIWKDMVIIITKIQRFYNEEERKHIMFINFFKCWNLKEALQRKSNIDSLPITGKMYATKLQMENRFKILQRKDENKSS
jgi:hypothetical protein